MPWEDSFSKGRNIGLKAARGQWILWLDADEQLEKEDQQPLRRAAIASKADALFLKLIHYQGQQKAAASLHLACRNAQLRLFRNKKASSLSGIFTKYCSGLLHSRKIARSRCCPSASTISVT